MLTTRSASWLVRRHDFAIEFKTSSGSFPENVNYAVEGAALLAFLAAQGVALPPPVLAIGDVEEGLPQALQDAVIPVVCLGP